MESYCIQMLLTLLKGSFCYGIYCAWYFVECFIVRVFEIFALFCFGIEEDGDIGKENKFKIK